MRNFILSLAFFFACTSIHGQTERPLKIGDSAPDFSLPFATQDSVGHGTISLSHLVGNKNIILAFYPADWSGGCTKEMCMMRDNFTALAEFKADIFGISGDYQFSHHEWAKYHHLPFTLLSDHSHSVAKLYGSYNGENGFNRRTVFLIDTKGKIAYLDLDYKAGDPNSFTKLQEAVARVPH